ncbi:hypothetical protein [Hyphomicrobium sp. CS1BSMeth3]|uniref:hypothetical protein n=1 Tax=Hyphomicrobium sp. CS1BSMeth3 TaxID=1892844 RepID=UPI0009309B88|nr:hypothetical protein [Hyphomicrobium sp. CS1BSMeth3]
MAGAMQAGSELNPYFESTEPEASVASDGADYASGLRSAQGDETGVRFAHSAASVEPILLARARLKLMLDPEGLIYVEAMGLADDVVAAGKRSGHLPQASVCDLVSRAVAADNLVLEEAPLEALASLQSQLNGALAMVGAAIANLKNDKQPPTEAS